MRRLHREGSGAALPARDPADGIQLFHCVDRAVACSRYSFIQRYRSGFSENAGEEFDIGFARLDHATGERFDLMWHRHTGQWLCLHPRLTLDAALRAIETEELVQPR